MESITIRAIEKKMLAGALLVSLGILAFISEKAAFSFVFGAALSLINFRFLSRGVGSLLRFSDGKNRAFTVLVILKYPLLLGLVGFVVLKTPVQVEAFVAGLLSLVFVIVWEGIFPKKQICSLGE